MKRGRRRKREQEERSEGRKKREKTIEITNLIDEERMGLEGSEVLSLVMSSKASNQDREHRRSGPEGTFSLGMLEPVFDNS